MLSPDDWRQWRELRLHALAQAPEAFGSTLAEWQGDGDTELRWRKRLEWAPFNVIALLDNQPAGMASGIREGDDIEVISMWVEPFARGRGTAEALIEAVASWAREQGAERLVLMVVETNGRARASYRRAGFVEDGPAVPDDDGRPEVPMARPLSPREIR